MVTPSASMSRSSMTSPFTRGVQIPDDDPRPTVGRRGEGVLLSGRQSAEEADLDGER